MGGPLAATQDSQLSVPSHSRAKCNESLSAGSSEALVRGGREMQEVIAQEEGRRERIQVLDAKRAEEVDRRCVIINAAHKAKYAAHFKAMRFAEMRSCPPRGLSLPPNSADSVVDFYRTFEIEAPGPRRGDRGSLMICCVCKRVYPEEQRVTRRWCGKTPLCLYRCASPHARYYCPNRP